MTTFNLSSTRVKPLAKSKPSQNLLCTKTPPIVSFPRHQAPSFFAQPLSLTHDQRNPVPISSKNPISDIVDDDDDDKPREECGVVGVFDDPEASRLCCLALHALQHRGQEGAGIVSVDTGARNSDEPFSRITGLGLVSEVFDETRLEKLRGDCAIGHVRYSTAGSSELKNVQPFVATSRSGSVAVAHNGNLVNYRSLREGLGGSIFNTTSDSEIVLHLIASSKEETMRERIADACRKIKGAYSMVFATGHELVAVRDPLGFRPLVMGRRSNGAVVFASETCALDLVEAQYEREVEPGEIVVVGRECGMVRVLSYRLFPDDPPLAPKQCVFEHIYFSMPHSTVFNGSVYESRRKLGEILAEESPAACDVVIAVPDSGIVAALGYAARSGVPFQQGLIRSHYVGRTFINPTQQIRDFKVKLKLAPVRAVLEGKRVVVVDDSMVRGTTSSKIVRMLKEAGAREVHMRIACPEIIGSCYYGVDTPSRKDLISNKMSVEEIREYIGADSLAFLNLKSLKRSLGPAAGKFCFACFDMMYPLDHEDGFNGGQSS